METEKQFQDDLISRVNNVLLYEDPEIQNSAIECIPIERLSSKASARAKNPNINGSFNESEFFIFELLRWFKFDFFKWVDVPKCEQCGNISEKKGMTTPTSEEMYWGAKRVELYYCTHCQVDIRFPRYNNPKKLLETKKGRCGEWANCFTLLCRSLGYDIRFVSDWNDHVWTEIYSYSQKRWLHCDPCENVYDAPLMYEIGWKKNMRYAIAFSKDEVQDVTWRYCTEFETVLSRRNLCRESWLLAIMSKITDQLQKTLSNERKYELLVRKVCELSEFLVPPKPSKTAETAGRISGSQAWKVSRGECQPIDSQKCSGHVFNLNRREIERKHFFLRYSCATDKYVRIFDGQSEIIGWNSLVHYHKDIFRKEEHDWNTAYLARKEGCVEGIITWKFDFLNTGLTIDYIKMYIVSQTFENGEISIFLGTHDTLIPIKDHIVNGIYQGKDVAGQQEFNITVKLTGGKGNVAWQHAQLFRQCLDADDFNFDIEIFFTLESVS